MRWSLLLLTLCSGAVWAQAPGFGLNKVPFTVRLLSPLSTKTANVGDTFTASVDQPTNYQGGVVEGRITKLNRPKKGKGKAEVQFQFDSLTFQNRTAPITADLTDVQNSQGTKGVDEEGQVIGRTSKKKRAIAAGIGAAAGIAAGAALGGATGAATGGAIGGALGLGIGLKMTTAGSEIEFKPGSIFMLSVSDAGRKR